LPDPNVDAAEFEELAEPPVERWVIRVNADGSGFEHRAEPLVGRVGNVSLEGVIVKPDGDGFLAFLADVPPDGAELRVGYGDDDLIDTGILYERGIG
jgi:hypothetical protein